MNHQSRVRRKHGKATQIDLMAAQMDLVAGDGCFQNPDFRAVGGLLFIHVLRLLVVAGFGFIDGEFHQFPLDFCSHGSRLRVKRCLLELGLGDAQGLFELPNFHGLFRLALGDVVLSLAQLVFDIVDVIGHGLSIDSNQPIAFAHHLATLGHFFDDHAAARFGPTHDGRGDRIEVAGRRLPVQAYRALERTHGRSDGFGRRQRHPRRALTRPQPPSGGGGEKEHSKG